MMTDQELYSRTVTFSLKTERSVKYNEVRGQRQH